jgi:sortase A
MIPARSRLSRSRPLGGVTFEKLLFVIGIGLAIAFSGAAVRAILAARRADRFVLTARNRDPAIGQQEAGTSENDGAIIPAGTFAGTYLSNGEDNNGPARVIGQLKIPDLGMTVPILSGIADGDLVRGVGHIPGSGNAGGLGNMAVAGHRDTFFRPLRRVKPGMITVVNSSLGSYRYQVDRTEIITPEQLKILDIGDQPQLTMITCYPFNFIGAAPKRFVVIAHLISAAPDTSGAP